MFNIRPIAKEDNLIIGKIIREVLAENHLDQPGTAYFDPQLDYLYDYYKDIDGGQYWVVTGNNGLSGGVGIAPIDFPGNTLGKVAELQKLYLDASVRGFGLSKDLMEVVISFAQDFGYDYLYLETFHTLVAAIHVYEKFGFERIEGPLFEGEHTTMDVFMVKDVRKHG
ncbi:GNAT family N-acetyltransferase [Aerococcus agrisoli]|uniref:GNAT family N-acetyltransferase n=1 Tax=Aerococcus agrisoli TaxID=2487350 RepID=A0A3N4GE43_9LACT|nr:GNAT family N-acetyltransferase [Aerococcus agrisoli]RPA60495.1 GNAT family N-acetyltransferase [Aerococcus agrisoli]